MSFRARSGIFLLKLSSVIRGLIPLVLTPRHLMEINKKFFESPSQINLWGRIEWIRTGLDSTEKKFLEKYGIKSGKILVLGCGGGRESIALSKLGFQVTGIDFVDELLKIAKKNAEIEKTKIDFQKQDITELSMEERFFDHAILPSAMYSFILIKEKRIKMLNNIKNALRPGGKLLLSVNFGFGRPHPKKAKLKYWIKKIIAFLTLGNIHYQGNEAISEEGRFFSAAHIFCDIKKFFSEIEEANLKVEETDLKSGYAILSA